MNFSEKYGNNIDEAVELALRDLKVSKDEVDVEVLEEPSKGFLGLGSKLAKVRVTLKEKTEPEIPAVEDIIKSVEGEINVNSTNNAASDISDEQAVKTDKHDEKKNQSKEDLLQMKDLRVLSLRMIISQ